MNKEMVNKLLEVAQVVKDVCATVSADDCYFRACPFYNESENKCLFDEINLGNGKIVPEGLETPEDWDLPSIKEALK